MKTTPAKLAAFTAVNLVAVLLAFELAGRGGAVRRAHPLSAGPAAAPAIAS